MLSEQKKVAIDRILNTMERQLSYLCNLFETVHTEEECDEMTRILKDSPFPTDSFIEFYESFSAWRQIVNGRILNDDKVDKAIRETLKLSPMEWTHELILFACIELKMSPKDASKWETKIVNNGLDGSEHEDDFYIWYYNSYISN